MSKKPYFQKYQCTWCGFTWTVERRDRSQDLNVESHDCNARAKEQGFSGFQTETGQSLPAGMSVVAVCIERLEKGD